MDKLKKIINEMFKEACCEEIVLEFNITKKGSLPDKRKINIDPAEERNDSGHAARVKVMFPDGKEDFSIPIHTDEFVDVPGKKKVKIKDLSPTQREAYKKLKPFIKAAYDYIYDYEMNDHTDAEQKEIQKHIKDIYNKKVK